MKLEIENVNQLSNIYNAYIGKRNVGFEILKKEIQHYRDQTDNESSLKNNRFEKRIAHICVNIIAIFAFLILNIYCTIHSHIS